MSASSYILSTQSEYHTATAALTGSKTGYQMIQYPIPNGSSWPFELTVDNSGHVWVVEQLSNQLGMFNPSNDSWKEYTLPTKDSTPNSVAVDLSGNVWITELTSNKLAELRSGSNTIVEYSIPNGTANLGGLIEPLGCGPVGVYVGPQQNIWILCDFSNQFDEFIPNNDTFYQFNLPLWESGPVGLVFDSSGNFWFTAANANELGNATVSELRNGTSDGIKEFAPRNQTYTFTFQHPINLEGNTSQIVSSLPTPAGIALSPDGSTLWVTEHVDSSFDSYNIVSKSLDRFWLSRTYMEYGYPISFPNAVAVDSSGNVWIAEHYGNKIAEYDPSTRSLTEYAVPCCSSTPYQSPGAGIYWLTLGKGGTVWFVEIYGHAIGELRPVNSSQTVSVIPKSTTLSFVSNRYSTINVPIKIEFSGLSTNATIMKLDASGTSSNGSIIGAYAHFSTEEFNVSGTGIVSSNFTLENQSLKPGIYDITLTANLTNSNISYSTVLEIDVSAPTFPTLILYAVVIGIVTSFLVIAIMSRHSNTRRRG